MQTLTMTKSLKTPASKRKPTPSAVAPCSADDLGKIIAAALFTSGDGKRAMRLQFLLQCETVWGGWSEPAAARHIADTIRKQNKRSSDTSEASCL